MATTFCQKIERATTTVVVAMAAMMAPIALLSSSGCSSEPTTASSPGDEETSPPDANAVEADTSTATRSETQDGVNAEDSRQVRDTAGRGRDANAEVGDGEREAESDVASDAARRPPTDGRVDSGASDGRLGDGATTAGDAVTADAPDGYRLVWAEEFEVPGPPDPSNWSFETGFVRNEEAQWYQPDNARVVDGLLVIEGRRERVQNPNYSAGSTDWKKSRQYAEYTASSIHSRGKRSFKFGRFEMRGRIPTQSGLWPAWWTLGNDGEWPSNGEIDIMEFYRGNLLANVACGTATRWKAKWDGSSKALSSFGDPEWSSKFHVWRMDWDDEQIVLYVDDRELNRTRLADMLNPDGTSPFRQAHYMLLNLAIGGVNGGDPAATAFPVRFEVDYVRVYQRS